MNKSKEKKVLLILSVGHSGSTLLDMSLGQFGNTFSTGELKYISWQLYREVNNIKNEEGLCTCNKGFLECDYWSNIISEIAQNLGVSNLDVPEKLKINYFEKLFYFDNSKVLRLKKSLLMRYPSISYLPGVKSYINDISKNNQILYNAIFNNTNADFIIDSSKDIFRFKELKKNNNVFPIIIIRDINGLKSSKHVVSDFDKLKSSWLKYYNRQLLPLLENIDTDKFHVISFEKFLDNPRLEIEKIAKKINLDVSSFSDTLDKSHYHLIAGNPMRYNDMISIKKRVLKTELYYNSINNSGLSTFYLDLL